jgi:uncharacterized protein (UPF0335 family)
MQQYSWGDISEPQSVHVCFSAKIHLFEVISLRKIDTEEQKERQIIFNNVLKNPPKF